MAGTLNGNIELDQTYLVWHTLKLDALTPPPPPNDSTDLNFRFELNSLYPLPKMLMWTWTSDLS